jgi:hypothetical protein
VRDLVDEVLAVVEHDHEVAIAQLFDECRQRTIVADGGTGGALTGPGRTAQRDDHVGEARGRAEVDEGDLATVVAFETFAHLDGQTGLPDTRWAHDRHEPGRPARVVHRRPFALASDQRRQRSRGRDHPGRVVDRDLGPLVALGILGIELRDGGDPPVAPPVERLDRLLRLPSSPMSRRASLIRLVSADSLTKRSPQTSSRISSLVTTRSRWTSRWAMTSNTCGCTGTFTPSRSMRRRCVSITSSPNANRITACCHTGRRGRAADRTAPGPLQSSSKTSSSVHLKMVGVRHRRTKPDKESPMDTHQYHAVCVTDPMKHIHEVEQYFVRRDARRRRRRTRLTGLLDHLPTPSKLRPAWRRASNLANA